MLDSSGFDLWADGYDSAVGVSDETGTYPFAGYKKVLGGIYRTVMEKPGAVVLDIGFGTAALTARLYENGCTVYGQDFSPRMIELASARMPGAHLFQGDFSQGLAETLRGRNYDFIVATYSLHHLNDGEKIRFLKSLMERLTAGGKILIGDVAFQTRQDLERCRREAGDEWDSDEFYFVADEMTRAFPGLDFQPVSSCAGILTLSPPDGPTVRSPAGNAGCGEQGRNAGDKTGGNADDLPHLKNHCVRESFQL